MHQRPNGVEVVVMGMRNPAGVQRLKAAVGQHGLHGLYRFQIAGVNEDGMPGGGAQQIGSGFPDSGQPAGVDARRCTLRRGRQARGFRIRAGTLQGSSNVPR